MYQRVNSRGQQECLGGSCAPSKCTLDVASPEDFLGWAYDEKQQGRYQPWRKARLHAVDEVNLRTCKVEKLLGQFVTDKEDQPKDSGNEHCQQQIGEELPPMFQLEKSVQWGLT